MKNPIGYKTFSQTIKEYSGDRRKRDTAPRGQESYDQYIARGGKVTILETNFCSDPKAQTCHVMPIM